MEIRDHAKERYVQRVMGISNIKESKRIAKENNFEVSYRILELINGATVVFEGYAPTRKETFDYYINKEILIVLKPFKKEVVTLFNVTLDHENHVNNKKIKEYVKQISKNNHMVRQLGLKQAKQDTITHHLEYMINRLRGEIDVNKFEIERDESIQICKDIAAQTKVFRLENREMMSEMFKKLEDD